MVPDQDVFLAKIAIMKRCVATVRQVQQADLPAWMRQDLTVLNLQRAVQAAIDLANAVIARYGLGLPSDYGQSFDLLARHQVVDPPAAKNLKKMVGFRNIAVHEYQEIDGKILLSIVEHHLDDFEIYYTQVHNYVFSGRQAGRDDS